MLPLSNLAPRQLGCTNQYIVAWHDRRTRTISLHLAGVRFVAILWHKCDEYRASAGYFEGVVLRVSRCMFREAARDLADYNWVFSIAVA
jgi:hypothetical protein